MACCKSSKSKLRLFEWDVNETVMQDVNPFKNTAPATMCFFILSIVEVDEEDDR